MPPVVSVDMNLFDQILGAALEKVVEILNARVPLHDRQGRKRMILSVQAEHGLVLGKLRLGDSMVLQAPDPLPPAVGMSRTDKAASVDIGHEPLLEQIQVMI
jgi:hypothetical protein